MNPFVLHISLYELAELLTLLPGLTLAFLLAFAKKSDRRAGLFLGLAVAAVVLKSGGLTPFLFPAMGALLYLYVRQLILPDRRFRWKDGLHFCALPVFYWLPGWTVYVLVLAYLYFSYRLIQAYYDRLRPVLMDRPRYAFRGLERTLFLLGLLCVFAMLNGIFCFAIAVVLMWMAARTILMNDQIALIAPITDRSHAREKARRLKEAVAAGRLYEDAELTLATLALKLGLHPHELSRIINVGLDKNFSDFINEFRVREIIWKMRDQGYHKLTLLGIAYESGFNSERTFHRTFKDITGKTPLEYKNSLKKQLPIDKLAAGSGRRPVLLRQEITKRNFMFRNYFKTAWRNLAGQKFYSALNIIGLTVGLAVGMLVFLWVNDELSFDSFNHNAAQIYRVNSILGAGSSKGVYDLTPPAMGYYALKDGSGVLASVRWSSHNDYAVISYKDKDFTDNRMFYTDASLFRVFDYPLLEGNARDPFPTDHSIIITKSTAIKYFGNEDPMGKVMQGDHKENFVVSGVMKDVPGNSSLQCDILFPLELVAHEVYGPGPGHSHWPSIDNDFGNYGWHTFVLLKPGAPLKPITDHLYQENLGHLPGQKPADIGHFQLQALSAIHLYAADGSSTGVQTVKIFSLVALLILLIAAINYVNLSTARAMMRAREVSVRKIIGASRLQLIVQFVLETLLFFAIALGFALIAIWLLLPYYNQLSGKNMHFELLNAGLWKVIGLTALATLLASSIYPALLLSSFLPINALKGKLSLGVGNTVFRKVLVVTQFVFSIALIIGTLVINRQLTYVREMALGYDKANVFTLPMRNLQDHYDAVRAELLKAPGILDVTSSSQNLVQVEGATFDNDWDGKDPRASFFIQSAAIDQDFFSFFKLQLLEGSGFTGAKSDTARLILNETAIAETGIRNPIGKRFRIGATKGIIAGVVKDFHFTSLKEKIQPFAFIYQPADARLYIKTTGMNAPAAIAATEKLWKAYNPGFPMDYTFLDDTYNQLYQSEQRTGQLFDLFAGVAIIISCLGLFGLAAYTAQVRVKEIGIRKVLGANTANIVLLFSKDFLALVALAIVIATPIAWYAMHQWIMSFAYRARLAWWLFALGGVSALLIALLTISLQSIKAALANPVKSLRSE